MKKKMQNSKPLNSSTSNGRQTQGKKRKFEGKVVSDKMQKTVIVEVGRVKIHPIYRKRYTSYRRFKAHDAENKYKTGDIVVIEETRPLSKEKKWRVIGKA